MNCRLLCARGDQSDKLNPWMKSPREQLVLLSHAREDVAAGTHIVLPAMQPIQIGGAIRGQRILHEAVSLAAQLESVAQVLLGGVEDPFGCRYGQVKRCI